ncbi:MAG TPA: IPT/TIG domain-containing protein [Blastocatellia bacterium]|nr:IPT/TIG domain-containing protein [Blastocatellia bacterium]
MINEFLADPPSGLAGDANGDGARSTSQDEFIEIVNRSTAPVDIGGFTISDRDQVRFTFPAATRLPAGEAAIVFGGGRPQGEFGNCRVNGTVFTASLSLNNGGDTITLRDAFGHSMDQVVYPSSQGNASQSINRSPDVTGARFVPHSTIVESRALFSPGTKADGAAFTTGPRIAEIAPQRVAPARASFTLAVDGSGFEPGTTVLIDRRAAETVFINESTMTATVPAEVAAEPGDHTVEARNPGGNRSNLVGLFVIPPPPFIESVLPSVLSVGDVDHAVFITGDNFDTQTVALIEGVIVPPRFINRRELSVTVPAQFVREPGEHELRVRSGDGQLSSAAALRVARPGGRIVSIAPDQAVAGANSLVIEIKGERFEPGSTAYFKETPLVTIFISASELRAELPASLTAEPGIYAIRVDNPGPFVTPEAVFRVLPVLPVIHAIAPDSVGEASGEVTLALTGARFKPGAIARIVSGGIRGDLLSTTVVTPELIEVRLPAALTQKAGRISIRVENPDRGFSSAIDFHVLISDPLIINEFLADPPSGLAGDANGDGARSTSQDEFIEIVNRSDVSIDLSGYRLSDADEVRHIFALGVVVPPGESVVVFGGGRPTGDFGNAQENGLVFKASSGGLSLNNTRDRVRLETGEGRLVQEIDFGPEAGNADQSLNREPDGGGALFSPHSLVGAGRLFSPGTRADGRPLTKKPGLGKVTPDGCRVGAQGLRLSVTGADFVEGAVVLFDNRELATLYLSDSALEAEISAHLLTEGGAYEVRVRNPKRELSGAMKFTVIDDPPRIDSLAPARVGTLAASLDVTIEGERFQRGAVVVIDRETLTPATVKRDRLTFVLPERFSTRAAALEIRVRNGDGNLSDGLLLTVENGPLITRVPRSRIRAGRGDVRLEVSGVGFKPGVRLFVGDTAVATVFVSETRLSAVLAAELTARPGALVIQARNLDGGRSNKITIRVVA